MRLTGVIRNVRIGRQISYRRTESPISSSAVDIVDDSNEIFNEPSESDEKSPIPTVFAMDIFRYTLSSNTPFRHQRLFAETIYDIEE